MTWLLVALFVIVIAGGALASALAINAKRDQRRRLEVIPGVVSNAPVEWAGAHTREANLHRRIGDAVAAARAQPVLNGAVFLQHRADLEEEALRIHNRLVAVSALTDARRNERIAEVGELVQQLETTVADLVTQALDDPSQYDAAIAESEIRLRALEAARAEVERADQGPPPAP